MARESSQALNLAVDALASYRVTRLLVSDGIVDRQRDALVDHLRRRGHRKLVDLSECPWCIGFWVACGVVAARRAVPRAWSPVAEAFAFSAVSGLLATEVQHEEHEPVEPPVAAREAEPAADTDRLFRRHSGRA
jgi:hypothetical protein